MGGLVKPEEFDYFHEVRKALQVNFFVLIFPQGYHPCRTLARQQQSCR